LGTASDRTRRCPTNAGQTFSGSVLNPFLLDHVQVAFLAIRGSTISFPFSETLDVFAEDEAASRVCDL